MAPNCRNTSKQCSAFILFFSLLFSQYTTITWRIFFTQPGRFILHLYELRRSWCAKRTLVSKDEYYNISQYQKIRSKIIFSYEVYGVLLKFRNTSTGNIQSQFSIQGSNCLLYTSPSPRDRTRSRMPSSA